MGKRTAPAGVAEAHSLLDLMDQTRPEPAAAGGEGHRARMRARLLESGPGALADHELIEMLLFLALPRRDTKPIAWALIDRFGGFGPAISAPIPDLLQIDGLGEAGAAALKIVQAATQRLLRGNVMQRPVMNNWDQLIDYLTAVVGHEKVEQFRVLFLDNRNRMVADEVLGRGTLNHAPVYPREVVKRALDRHAAALILVHNHPSGDPTPSREDVAMTREVQRAAEALRITVHDHIIMASGRWVSFRREGLLS